MDLISSLEITASGLSAQRTRLNIISQNLANSQVTRTPEGGPYRRQVPVFKAMPFVSHLTQAVDSPHQPRERDPRRGVFIPGIYQQNTDFKRVYDPSHPDADEEGYVLYPNVDVVTEMSNLINASRSYEAGVTAANAAKSMAQKALEIGR